MANPSAPKTVRHVVLIDSSDRDTQVYAQGQYTLMLPQEYKNVSRVRLLTAEVPFSFYINTAAKGATTFVVALGVGAGVGAPQSCTVPDGTYTIYTIGAAIALAVASNAVFVAHGFTMGVVVDPKTRKITLTGTAAFTLDTTTTVAKATLWGLPYFMGFAKNTVYASDAAAFTLTGPAMTNFVPDKYIILDIDHLNIMDETMPVSLVRRSNQEFGTNGNHRSAFAKVPLSAAPFDLILFDADTNNFNEVVLTPVLGRLDRLSILWRFHDGTVIDFNGVDHSLTLEIECLERGNW